MAMWALGAFDKMKNAVTEKINFKEVGTRLIKNITVFLAWSRFLKANINNNHNKITKLRQS